MPISGVTGVRVRGQGTCPSSLATGAAKSEPHCLPAVPQRDHQEVRCRAGCRGVPGGAGVVGGAMVDKGCAHCLGWYECIYGVL